jgi:FtsP/CotA-like multicopper oxidase with cupredoxin domain
MRQKFDRRTLLRSGAATTAGALVSGSLAAHGAQPPASSAPMEGNPAMGAPVAYVPVECPDVPKLTWELVEGVKVFRLRAEPLKREFAPGWTFDVWGYNGSMPGPTLEVMEGDRVRIFFENRLPELQTVHWHGLEVPNDMDGVEGLTQDPVPPGGSFVYEFTLRQNGTFFYHTHQPMSQLMGPVGLFVIHPRVPDAPKVDHDFGLITQGWHVLPTNTIPATLIADANWATLNGRAGPAGTPLIVKQGSRVRIRMVNLSMDHHPMHLHGHQFHVTGNESGRLPEPQWVRHNTVIVPVGGAQDIEFVAEREGDWMFHCHLPHHMMNWSMTPMVGPLMRAHGMMPVPRPNGGPAGSTVEARQVPGWPQDMFMPMDEAVAKPETAGMRPGWSGGVMGMSTVVRILKPEEYEGIQQLRKQHAGRVAVSPWDHQDAGAQQEAGSGRISSRRSSGNRR